MKCSAWKSYEVWIKFRTKIIQLTKFFLKNVFWTNTFFGPKFFFGPNFFFRTKIFFTKFFFQTNILFRTNIFFRIKIFWVRKNLSKALVLDLDQAEQKNNGYLLFLILSYQWRDSKKNMSNINVSIKTLKIFSNNT